MGHSTGKHQSMKWAGPGQRKKQHGKSSLISASPARNQILSSARDFDFCLHRFLHVPFPLFSALARSIPHSLGASFHLDGLRTDFSFGLHRGDLSQVFDSSGRNAREISFLWPAYLIFLRGRWPECTDFVRWPAQICILPHNRHFVYFDWCLH